MYIDISVVDSQVHLCLTSNSSRLEFPHSQILNIVSPLMLSWFKAFRFLAHQTLFQGSLRKCPDMNQENRFSATSDSPRLLKKQNILLYFKTLEVSLSRKFPQINLSDSQALSSILSFDEIVVLEVFFYLRPY